MYTLDYDYENGFLVCKKHRTGIGKRNGRFFCVKCQKDKDDKDDKYEREGKNE